jgi:hypothetical protein
LQTCEPSQGADTGGDGLLLNATGDYVALRIIDYPDAQAHLANIYLTPGMLAGPLTAAQRQSLTRVVVEYPIAVGGLTREFDTALAATLKALGAHVLRPAGY